MPRQPTAKKSTAQSKKAGQVKVKGAARHSTCWPTMKPTTCGGSRGIAAFRQRNVIHWSKHYRRRQY